LDQHIKRIILTVAGLQGFVGPEIPAYPGHDMVIIAGPDGAIAEKGEARGNLWRGLPFKTNMPSPDPQLSGLNFPSWLRQSPTSPYAVSTMFPVAQGSKDHFI
jgi:hypothetical protein